MGESPIWPKPVLAESVRPRGCSTVFLKTHVKHQRAAGKASRALLSGDHVFLSSPRDIDLQSNDCGAGAASAAS